MRQSHGVRRLGVCVLMAAMAAARIGANAAVPGWAGAGTATATDAATAPCRPHPAPPLPLPRGVVSVVDGFGADPSGKQDSTLAIQRAFTAARTQNITLFVPFGCYTVTDTLNATEPRNGRWQPVVVVGQAPTASWMHRPAFVLPPSSPRFSDGTAAKPVLFFVTNWCLEPGAGVDAVATGCTSSALPANGWHASAYQFNQVLQGVDVVLGAGNPAAVGIDMNAAQGTTLEDVTVHAASDALAGVAGGNGGGGSFKGVTVIGAKYGIDSRQTGDAPTMVAVTLINQTCAGLLHGSSTTVIATGFRVRGSPALAGVLAGVDPTAFHAHPDCHAPKAPGVAVAWANTPSPGLALHSAASMVDSSIVLEGSTPDDDAAPPCIIANSSLYLSDVYVAGCRVLVASGGRSPLLADGPITRIKLLAFGRLDVNSTQPVPSSRTANPPPPPAYVYAFPSYQNGSRSADGVATTEPSRLGPPPGLESRHWLAGGATWQTAGAVSALDVGCTGDGVTDDWAALQAAVQAHAVVVLPKGFYRLSQPLVLSRDAGALVGVGRTLSIVMATGDARWGERPLVDVHGDGVTVGFLSVVVWDHLPLSYALEWRGVGGVWRQAWFNRMQESAFPPFSAPAEPPRPVVTPHPGLHFNRALTVITGGGAFYDFNLDFGCCFGTALPPPSVPVPPDTASSGEVWLQGPRYRTILINGSTAGVRFYPLNAEQDFGEAHTEISWSSNVTIYGAKSENNYVVLWIRDSTAVTLHGYGGNAAAFANKSAGGVRQDGRVAEYMPSLFRVQRSTQIRLANLIDAGRVTSPAHPSVFVAAGNGTDPRLWNMVLYQDGDALCDPGATPTECSATATLDRPVVWEWP